MQLAPLSKMRESCMRSVIPGRPPDPVEGRPEGKLRAEPGIEGKFHVLRPVASGSRFFRLSPE
jgi:hypothetical protein